MNDSRIEWTDKVANPIKTKYRHKCSWNGKPWCYMFAKNFYQRIEGRAEENKNVKPYKEELNLDLECLRAPRTRGKTIFIGSGTDVWGAWVPVDYKQQIIDELKKLHKSNTIILLTKNAEGYLGFEFADNMICGITIETDLFLQGYESEAPHPIERIKFLQKNYIHSNILVSIEPVLDFSPYFLNSILKFQTIPRFIILGFNTSREELIYPGKSKLENFITEIGFYNQINLEVRDLDYSIELLIKPNLTEAYGIEENCYPIDIYKKNPPRWMFVD